MIVRPDFVALLAVTIVLLATLAVRPELTRQRGGKMLAFVAVFLLPVATAWSGVAAHLEISKKTEFCLSCHPMEVYGKSLRVDDTEYIPAVHFQNHAVPPEKACYTCHTDYALYGDVRSKLRGFRHLLVQYSGSVPDTIKLYQPYSNRECLHCHEGARSFLAADVHTEEDTTLASMLGGRTSCTTSGCHDVIHDVRGLENVELWKGAAR